MLNFSFLYTPARAILHELLEKRAYLAKEQKLCSESMFKYILNLLQSSFQLNYDRMRTVFMKEQNVFFPSVLSVKKLFVPDR